MLSPQFKKIAVIGGGGYVGSALVPFLLDAGYEVKVIDLFLFGNEFFKPWAMNPKLSLVKADIRNEAALKQELKGIDAVIHLACVSNDPSFELDPALGRSINYDAFLGLLRALRGSQVRRFIYASSSSVYGVKTTPNVREDAACEPLTDYSKYKLLCEQELSQADVGEMEYVILRPATVCGYAPRLRLDLTVNILTIHALVHKVITVFGGKQLRPNINMKDMIAVYRLFLESPRDRIDRQVFNAGYANLEVLAIAELVRRQIGDKAIQIKIQETNDNRSYHVNSDKIRDVLGFTPRFSVEDAIQSLIEAYRGEKIPEPLHRPDYYNIKVMQNLNLKVSSPIVEKISA